MTTLTPRRRAFALVVLISAVLLLAIDGTVLYLALPSLQNDLHPSATQVLWIGDIYSLAIAGLLITMGSLADRIGRKRLLLSGAAAFGLASVLAAFAHNAETLIVARLLLGIAGATLMPSTLSIIRNIYTDAKERARAIAIWSAAAGGGAALGPLLGGVLLEHFWWGSVFLLNVPVMVFLLVGGCFLLPESKDPNPGPFDLVSASLSMLALIPLVYAIKHVMQDGLTVPVALTAALTAVAGVLFVRRQLHLAKPMIDMSLFRNPAFSGALVANFVAIFALTGLLFFFSQYLQYARGLSPLRAGAAELPGTLASIAVIAIIGWLTARLGEGRTIALGLGTTAFGLLAVSGAQFSNGLVPLLAALIPVGLGVGLAMTLTVDAIISAVRPEKAGAASATSETAYELGAAIGVAVLGSILGAFYRHGVSILETVPAHARESVAATLAVTGRGNERGQVALDAFQQALQYTALIAAAIVAVSAAVAWRTIPSPKNASPKSADRLPTANGRVESLDGEVGA